jgi:hypothetical protein
MGLPKSRPPLTEKQILAWADTHRRRTGKWPSSKSGSVIASTAKGESWYNLDHALRNGYRGLKGASSLAQLLIQYRGKRNRRALPRLEVKQILAWADAHHAKTGRWPHAHAGVVDAEPRETWAGIDRALTWGYRGLPGWVSLAQLLAKHRQVPHRLQLPHLNVKQILAWADDHFRRTGKWPVQRSGSVAGVEGATWANIDQALRQGCRGLRGGSSLALLLHKHRRKRASSRLPKLTIDQVLAWADAHYAATGRWPKRSSGAVQEAPHETWMAIEGSLARGSRGLVPGNSLAGLLAKHRQVRNLQRLLPLSETQILAWADKHARRTGNWPTADSGPIGDTGETWSGVDAALLMGSRGLPGGSSLPRLLHVHRGKRIRSQLPELSVEQILAWADAHHAATGHWPKRTSGDVEGAEGETWMAVDFSLHHGRRGLKPGSSLPALLAERRGVRYQRSLPHLSEEQILAWADEHRHRTGKWPTAKSGPVDDSGETWSGIAAALREGLRGFPGGSSLAALLHIHRGKRVWSQMPKLSVKRILTWADAHHAATGGWPKRTSGDVQGAEGESWGAIDSALVEGSRGLKPGSSLPALLAKHRGVRNLHDLAPLSEAQILVWVDEYVRRTGECPRWNSGPIGDTGETWCAVHVGLRQGNRGLPGGSSLPRLLKQHGR